MNWLLIQKPKVLTKWYKRFFFGSGGGLPASAAAIFNTMHFTITSSQFQVFITHIKLLQNKKKSQIILDRVFYSTIDSW